MRLRNLVEEATTPALVFDPNPVVEQGSRTGLADNNDADYPALDPLYRAVTLLDLGAAGCLQGQWVNAIVPAARCPAGRNFGSVKRSNACDCFDAAMAYFHIDRMQRYLQGLGFANVVHRSIPVNLHATAEDNSFYSPTTRALNFGDGGVDDAQDADVISHEYGHAIQDSQVPGFGVTTEGGTLGEGFGDYWQAAMSANQGNADVFNTCFAEWDTSAVSDDPLPCLRNVDHPWTVDQAVSECGGREIHCVGQAWANLLWTIRKQLGGATSDRLVVQSQFSYAIESGFRDASLALLFADQQLNGGANRAFLLNLLVARGFLTLDELDDQPSGALPLVFPGDASGAAGVNTDERDVFAVQLPAGAGVVFQVHSAGNAVFTLALYGPGTTTIEGGTAVARTAAGSASPRVAFAPTTAGTYYLVVAADAGDGTYTVSALVDVDRDGAAERDRQLPVDLESDPGRLEQEREGRRLRPRVEDRDRPARGPRPHDHRDRRPAPARRRCDRLGRRSAEGWKGRRPHARQRREAQRTRRRGRHASRRGCTAGCRCARVLTDRRYERAISKTVVATLK